MKRDKMEIMIYNKYLSHISHLEHQTKVYPVFVLPGLDIVQQMIPWPSSSMSLQPSVFTSSTKTEKQVFQIYIPFNILENWKTSYYLLSLCQWSETISCLSQPHKLEHYKDCLLPYLPWAQNLPMEWYPHYFITLLLQETTESPPWVCAHRWI